MSRDEALEIVRLNAGWNSSQRSISFAMRGVRDDEDDLLDARRATLAKAWTVLGGAT